MDNCVFFFSISKKIKIKTHGIYLMEKKLNGTHRMPFHIIILLQLYIAQSLQLKRK